jgi:ATP-dependent exoDNAse (exonuclease V) beta subunit
MKRLHSPKVEEEVMQLLNGYVVPKSCATEILPLARKNGHERDSSIAFDDAPHVYYVRGKSGFTSVTSVVHENFEEFDSVKVAKKMSNRRDFKTSNKYEKYQQLVADSNSPDELVELIVKSWQDNGAHQAALGTAMHRYIELHANALPQEDDVMLEECMERQYYHAYDKKQRGLGMEPYRTEWMLWDEELQVTGSIDMIYYNTNSKTYHMVDWKRSKEIKKVGYGRGKGACDHMHDCNYTHYSLQLNIYKYLLEKNYGVKIKDMHILVFHPSNDEAIELRIDDMQEFVIGLLYDRV